MQLWGQCFLCERDSQLERVTDYKGDAQYKCWHCGGLNTPKRVEASRDNAGRPMVSRKTEASS